MLQCVGWRWRGCLSMASEVTLVKHRVPVTVGALQCHSLLPHHRLFYAVATKALHTSSSHKFTEDKKTTSLALVDAMKQVRHSPKPALLLGFSGLIPFAAVPAYMMSTGIYDGALAQAQLFYGASILSFLGGVRWGLTLPEGSPQPPDWHNLGYGVAPSLVAWLGLLAPHTMGLIAVMGGLVVAGYMDIAMWGYPGWFKGMRFCLTFMAVLSLWTTLVFKLILPIIQDDEKGKEPVKSAAE